MNSLTVKSKELIKLFSIESASLCNDSELPFTMLLPTSLPSLALLISKTWRRMILPHHTSTVQDISLTMYSICDSLSNVFIQLSVASFMNLTICFTQKDPSTSWTHPGQRLSQSSRWCLRHVFFSYSFIFFFTIAPIREISLLLLCLSWSGLSNYCA